MSKNISYFAVLLAVGLALLSSCGGSKKPELPTAVFKTMKVEQKDITLDMKYSATIRGRQDIEVYPQVGGTLQKLCVTEGQHVTKGQTLFIIDQVPFQAQLNTAEAALKAAQAAQATAQLNYDSRKRLFEQQVVSEFDLQTAQNQLLSAKAQVAQAQAAVVNARNSLSYTVVKSPADGVVGVLPYRQGALVGSQMPKPLTTVSDNKQMYVYFSVNEAQMLSMLRANGSMESAISAMPEVSLMLVDGTEYEHKGKVESVSGVVDRQTGSIQLRAVFDNPSGLLHSGSTGNVVIPVTHANAIVIPTAATVQLQDKFKVWVVNKDNIAEEQLVELGDKISGSEVVVLKGLEKGVEIVAEGAGMVKAGQKVK